jgi:anti-sigma factor RsiW
MSDPHWSAGSYVLGALEPAEVLEFKAHFATCVICRSEVVTFGETLAELSLLTLAAPPPTLRTAVLDVIRRTPQLGAGVGRMAVVRDSGRIRSELETW